MTGQGSPTSFEILRRIGRKAEAGKRCELCNERVASTHDHLLEPETRKILCVCEACGLLFDNTTRTKYKRVPRRILFLNGFEITNPEWDSLAIPIGMAFFVRRGTDGRMLAIYPSPAGPVESLLTLDAWEEIASRSSSIGALQTDVEAVLANRAAGEYYIAPIDECFRLVGLIRAHWRGLSGGTEVWNEIRSFFAGLNARATPEVRHA